MSLKISLCFFVQSFSPLQHHVCIKEYPRNFFPNLSLSFLPTAMHSVVCILNASTSAGTSTYIVSAVPVWALTEQLIKIERIVKIRFMLAHFFFFSFQTWNNSKTVANTIALTRQPTTYFADTISARVTPVIKSQMISRIVQMMNAATINAALSFVNIFITVKLFPLISQDLFCIPESEQGSRSL